MEYDKSLKNRLKRIEGQIRGVIRMMEEGKECRDVVTQLTACRAAIDRAIALVVGKNLELCLRRQMEDGEYEGQDLVQQAMRLLINRTTFEQDKSECIIDDLREIEVHIHQVLKMMEERKECLDVVMALNACRTAIDTSVAFVVGKNIETCLRHQMETGQSSESAVQAAIDLLVKSK